VDAPQYVAALDIGGTKTSAAVLDDAGRIAARAVGPTPAGAGADAVLDGAARLVREVIGRCDASAAALGVGTAGVVDPGTGAILSSTDAITGWAGTDVAGGLRRRLRLPVAVDNDVHAHLAGELTAGPGAGKGCVVLVAVGTGVGGSIAIDGRIHRGHRHVAGHLGHVPSPSAGDMACSCGGTGHVEAVASGPAMVRAYNARSAHHASGPAADLREVAARAATGADERATSILADGGTEIGRLVGGLINVLDPDLVIVTGGVSESGPAWWAALLRAAGADLLPPARAAAPPESLVVRSILQADAALIGAAQIARERAA
jgi:glucokinase